MLKLYTEINLSLFSSTALDLRPPLLKYPHYFDFKKNIEDADYVVLPIQYHVLEYFSEEQYKNYDVSNELLSYLRVTCKKLIEQSLRYGKKTIYFFYRDEMHDITASNAIVFCTSLFKSKQQENEFVIPAWKITQVELNSLSKGQKHNNNGEKGLGRPKVGFRGASLPVQLAALKPRLIDWLNDCFYYLGLPVKIPLWGVKAYQIRGKAMRMMSKKGTIDTDFHVVRGGEKGGQNKQLFIDNLLQNDYNLCVSGYGNYSYRLYEVLAAGRIPIFIDTDCVLPYDFHIDWANLFVWEDDANIQRVAKTLINFHSQFTSEQQLRQHQEKLRALWEEYLSEEGFCKHFHLHFD